MNISSYIKYDVFDFIKLHSCIKNITAFDDGGNEVLFTVGDNPCVDLESRIDGEVTDDVRDRLLDLNRLS